MATATIERPTELRDCKEYREAAETLERVQGETVETEKELHAVKSRLNSRSLEIESDAVLAGEFDLSENGDLRSRHNDLVALRRAQQAAIVKQQTTLNGARSRASVQICDAHRDEYRELMEQTRSAAEELLRLTKSRMEMRDDLKSRGISWYLPAVRPLELNIRLPELLTDCSDAIAELSKETD